MFFFLYSMSFRLNWYFKSLATPPPYKKVRHVHKETFVIFLDLLSWYLSLFYKIIFLRFELSRTNTTEYSSKIWPTSLGLRPSFQTKFRWISSKMCGLITSKKVLLRGPPWWLAIGQAQTFEAHPHAYPEENVDQSRVLSERISAGR
jgi:hypothetical protein